MIGWIKNLDEQSRKISITEASRLSGISSKAIEKDWWVTLTLKILFESKYASYFAFKGGTSLSKGWGIINRFSEDIDIALDSEAFGIEFNEQPSKNFVEQLRRAGCDFTSNELLNELKSGFAKLQLPDSNFSMEAERVKSDMPDTDPQTIYVNYNSLFDPNPYLPDRVKIEFSVRSKREPNETREMSSILNAYFPNPIYEEQLIKVLTIKPERTLIEKILLLHEEYNRNEVSKMRTHRMSRHYYDIYMIYRKSQFGVILKNNNFIQEVIHHRKLYSRLRHFEYNSLQIGKISIIPLSEIIIALENDYQEMSHEMMYGETPTFREILEVVKEIEATFNLI
ncbi:MAG: nucleotidyl transferase AbiEii/AbiGii toxin family protein [Flavobacteriales bacterium]|nr:nucleotidyl transferase AbiEii/AbiGii toxin family protein [Flavobacteriales bacterium]